MELKNKIAIVTGASKGIGLATAKALLNAGAKVVAWNRSKPAIDHQNFTWIKCDVSKAEEVEKAFEQTTKEAGDDIAILVNNAGLGIHGNLVDTSLEDWHTMVNLNINGVFYCSRLVIPKMKALGKGHIINISSIAGTNGIDGFACYSATKHAVRGLSHSLFKEVRNDGIKVTCIYPGSTNTHFFDDIEGVNNHQHMMRPEDIAEAIMHAINTHPNFHIVDVEMRPLKPKG